MALADTARLIATLELQDKFSGTASKFNRTVTGLESGFSRMGRGASQVASGLNTLGTRAAIAAAGGLTAVVTTAASFEQAFTGIEKTVDATEAQFVELEGQFRQMARTIPLSFEELANIGAAGGALGIARKDLLDFTDVVARLAVSTNLSSDQAATALGQLGNVLHLSGGEFREFADSLVALGNAGASTEDQIVEMAARFGAAGNSAGLTKEEILALSSAVASMGIEVEAGGSALSRIFNNVATNIGTSSSKASAFAEALGLSAAEFRTAWDRDALGTLQDFLAELNKLDQFEQASLLKDVGITNTRDIAAVRLMGQNVKFVGEQLEIADTAQGALNTESQKFFDTAQSQWKVLINNVRDAGATIGTELLPVFKEVTEALTEFLDDPAARAKLKTFGQDLAAGARSLIAAFKSGEFQPFIDGLKGAASIARAAFEAFNALPGPVKQLAFAAIVANKVSGGAIGQIAGGLGNIFAGAIKVAFPKLDIFGRGSFANPMFTKEVGLPSVGGGAAGGGIASALGGKGFWGGVGKVFGVAAAVTIGAEIGRAVGGFLIEGQVRPAIDFETGEFKAFVDRNSADAQKLQSGIDILDDSIHGIAGNTVDGLERWLIPGLSELEQQRALLKEQLDAAIAQQTAAFDNNRTEEQLLGEAKAGRLATAHAEQSTTDAIRNLKPITAESFRAILARDSELSDARLIGALEKSDRSLTAEQFIRALRTTSEFGGKAGTTIEQGKISGEDPFGRVFLRLARLVQNPKAPAVLFEIRNHIKAAEEVQVAAIKAGDREAVQKLQGTIDGLHKLIGSVDSQRPKLEGIERNTAASQRTAQETKQAIYGTAEGTRRNLLSIISGTNQTAANTAAVARKDFSPRVSVAVNTNTSVSVNDVVRAVNNYTYAVNTFGGRSAADVGILG